MFTPAGKLGKTLIKKNLVTPAQWDEAMRAAKEDPDVSVDQFLIEKGYIEEVEILKIDANELGHAYVNLSEVDFDPKLVKMIPRHIAEKYKVMIVSRADGKINLAMANPLNPFAIDDINTLTNSKILPMLGSEKQIMEKIDEVYTQLESADDILGGMVQEDQQMKAIEDEETLSTTALASAAEEAPVIRLSNSIIMQAVKDGASDIHVEPSKTSVRIRFRIDGVMHEEMKFPRKLHAALVSRFKILAKLDIGEKRVPQDGRIPLRVEGKEIDLRVATLPTVWGEKVTMRILDKSSILIGLEQLGFESNDLKRFRELINKPYGIIFSTGPTGSGKTTTLYAVLNELNGVDKNLISIEDPIEYQLPGVAQAQVNTKAGLTFAGGLRSMLRQDPDIVMVGELRDKETAEVAIQASLTGHLVLATIHANDSASTITRLFHMGVEPYLVASSVICILAQRLVRKICPECKVDYTPPPEALQRLGIPPGTKLYRGQGCEFCRETGYLGRVGVYEMMQLDDELRLLITEEASAPDIRRKGIELGMYTLQQDGIRKVIAGVTSIEEAMRVLFDTGVKT
ncbi:MAG TPA: ATPase, T2SS/T4P/T4SS family [bacterium]|nr:MAG: Type II secretion system protein E [bacterium ADurb.Bin236]HPI77004.1 ATPase, T2SS/T4P/T4SS family [bacterium]HPN95801.1 ATPase, T2SS/T4P/T4SS family [bacterium]